MEMCFPRPIIQIDFFFSAQCVGLGTPLKVIVKFDYCFNLHVHVQRSFIAIEDSHGYNY